MNKLVKIIAMHVIMFFWYVTILSFSISA